MPHQPTPTAADIRAAYLSHMAHAKRARVSVPCTAHHVNFGGGCLNCGWLPPKVPAGVTHR